MESWRKILLDDSKSVYPYEYMDTWETKLRPKNAFCSKLNIKGISDHDYKHAQQVWNSMKKKTLSRYHDTYWKKDVFLLTDVFETFQNTCLKHYKLDPAYFYTTPGLPWQAFLKTASDYYKHKAKRKGCELCLDGFRLELLRDIDMLLMFHPMIQNCQHMGLRGRKSMILLLKK